MKDYNAVIMVGISGSGKSTVAKEYEKKGYTLLSTDAIRGEISTEEDQSHNEEVFKILHRRIKDCVEAKKNFVVDATNLTVKNRRGLLNCINKKGKEYYSITAVVMTTPNSLCYKWNNSRSRKVPDDVVQKQIKRFEIPTYEEGFDEIILDNWDIPELPKESAVWYLETSMNGFDQKNKHHKYDLGTHCKKCYEELSKYTDNIPFLTAARLHDFGKLFTQEEKDDGSGDCCYYSHHNVGAQILLQNLDLLGFTNTKDIIDCLFYVNFHMAPFFWNGEKGIKKAKDTWGGEKVNNLILFNKCDKIASGNCEEEENV